MYSFTVESPNYILNIFKWQKLTPHLEVDARARSPTDVNDCKGEVYTGLRLHILKPGTPTAFYVIFILIVCMEYFTVHFQKENASSTKNYRIRLIAMAFAYNGKKCRRIFT